MRILKTAGCDGDHKNAVWQSSSNESLLQEPDDGFVFALPSVQHVVSSVFPTLMTTPNPIQTTCVVHGGSRVKKWASGYESRGTTDKFASKVFGATHVRLPTSAIEQGHLAPE
jgi:hypothetical protein